MHQPILSQMTHQEIRARLKPDMQQLADELSRAELITFIEVFGGGRAFIPVPGSTHSKLARILGADAASRLGRIAGRLNLYVPHLRLEVDARHRRIIQLCDEGLLCDEIAREVGVSNRRVYAVLARAGKSTKLAAQLARMRTGKAAKPPKSAKCAARRRRD